MFEVAAGHDRVMRELSGGRRIIPGASLVELSSSASNERRLISRISTFN